MNLLWITAASRFGVRQLAAAFDTKAPASRRSPKPRQAGAVQSGGKAPHIAALLLLLASLPLAAQRLPRVVFPVRYEMTITPDLDSETFTGDEVIAVSIEQATRSIELNASDIEFQSVTVTSAGNTQTATAEIHRDGERASLNLEHPIPVGPATIHIAWKGTLNRQLRGFYIGVANGKKYLASQMESVDARHAFPSFDEPEYKAHFQLTAIIDPALKAFSNSAIESETARPDGKRAIRFAMTPRMSTYLLALVVGDFDCLSDSVDGIPTRVCGAPDKIQFGRYALESAKKHLQFLNHYYSIPYPFQKLDHLALADFAAGAMENAGAITYRDRYLTSNPATVATDYRKQIDFVIAHETAHQWFGDLVTMRWWDDIWLNEGFATWMEHKAVAATRPEWDIAMDALASTGGPLRADVLSSTRAIHHPVETRQEIDEVFDAIAYEKTGAVLRMIESYIGEENFRDGINRYIARHAYGNASAGDFAAALTEASGENIGDVLNSFVKEPGVPLVTMKARCEGDATIVDLSQERFFVRRDLIGSAPDQLWAIPVCMRVDGDRRCVLFRGREQSFRFPGCHPSIFANADGRGYYLTNQAANRDLATALNKAERYALLRDEWFLARAGLRNVGAYLELAETMVREDDATLIEELTKNLETLERYVVTDAERPALQNWMRRVLTPIAQKLGWKERPGESDQDAEGRAWIFLALGDYAADPSTRRQARDVALQYLKDPASVSPSVGSKALMIAAIEGDAKLYDAYLRAFRSAKDVNVRVQLRNALAAFRDRQLLRRTLDLAMSDEVRSQDAARLIGDVLANRAGEDIGWEFVRQNWDAISKKIPPGDSRRILNSGVGATCSLARRNELRQFVKDRGVKDAARATLSAAEKMTTCVEFRDLQKKNLEAWLK